MDDTNECQVFHDVACTRCGCVCDDLTVSVRGNRIESFSPPCPLAAEWFPVGMDSPRVPDVLIHGQPAAMDEGVRHAARLLSSAKSPLIFGLSRSSTAGQRAACELADLVGATVDTTASIGHGPSIMAVQVAGESTCSLGEVRHRSDLVIYWRSNPLVTHPRHMERVVNAPGMFVPEGRAGRFVVVVDSQPTESSQQADLFLQIPPGSDFEILWILRALVKGLDPGDAARARPDFADLQRLTDLMKSCRYGSVFFGVGLAESATGHLSVEALLRLVTDLNSHTRFVARRMRIPGDVTGADSVLCWRTGYPFSVNLNRGYPRYNPGEYSAGPMLDRGEADCVLLLGAERVQRFSDQARASLNDLPVIILDPPSANWGIRADVRFHTAVYGIHRQATAYRMDEVPIPLTKILSSQLMSDDEVLRQIIQTISN